MKANKKMLAIQQRVYDLLSKQEKVQIEACDVKLNENKVSLNITLTLE
jgi:hypothetical protein